MKIDNLDDKYVIYGMLFSLSNRIQTIGDKDFEDITMKQHFLMVGLTVFEKPPTLREMGELIGCSYQNVKRMAELLQQKGYLNIVQDENDKRKQLLVSTGKLEEKAERTRDVTVAFMDNLYKGINKQDLAVTLKTLKKMDQNIGGIVE